MIRVDNSGFDWEKIGYKLDKKCKYCGSKSVYHSWEYDAYFCGACNSWLEKKCKDKYCMFCANRPRTPVEELRTVEYKISKQNN